MFNVVHVSHEVVQKIGGIGSVLEGLITSDDYDAAVGRTVLLCPLFTTHGDVDSRLGPQGEVLYSSLDGRTDHPLAGAFREIQERYRVEIVYGRRLYRDALHGTTRRPEVILIDVSRCAPEPVNWLKGRFFDAYGIRSDRYEQSWDYEQWLRLAEPGLAALRALGVAGGPTPCVVIAHEFMGMPTALAARLRPEWGIKTAFHAHEVGTIRRIVEDHPGHDTTFYNVLRLARAKGLTCEDVFGDQHGYYRHALVEASAHLDVTLAVGDFVVDELRFLSHTMAQSNIRLCYNGIPAYDLSEAESAASKNRLRDYIETLLGYRPDFVFTHVTRMTPSKGLWRDVRVMEYIEEQFRRQGLTGVLIVLSTEIGGPRRREDIVHMERWWDWPVAHREGAPDLSGGEALFYANVQGFNARSRNCKILFINQFGFDRAHCGDRMSEHMEFWDIRRGSDVEFGQSIYEPFGIAQLEAISFGSICVMTNVCGCAGFVNKATGGQETPNVIIADYTDYRAPSDTIEAYMDLSRAQREALGERVAHDVAQRILERLPRSHPAAAACIDRGYDLATRMSWDAVVRDYFLPAMKDICEARTSVRVA